MKNVFGLMALLVLVPFVALAEEPAEFTLTVKDHIFTPAVLEVPAEQKIKLTIINQDTSPEEFESSDLNREKIIAANTTGTVFIGPLKAGEYKYVGEFHEDTAKGTIVAKEGGVTATPSQPTTGSTAQ